MRSSSSSNLGVSGCGVWGFSVCLAGLAMMAYFISGLLLCILRSWRGFAESGFRCLMVCELAWFCCSWSCV